MITELNTCNGTTSSSTLNTKLHHHTILQYYTSNCTALSLTKPSSAASQQPDLQDPERVQQIMERAVKDAKWIQTKYAKKA